MADEDRDADGRAGDPQLGQVEDLAALGDDLPLLLGVAVVQEDVDLGQRVEGDRVRVDASPRAARPATWARIWPSSSARASAPVPDTDWYVSTMTRSRPTVSRSAISTGTSCIVEQFGLAMMPSWPSRSSGLTWLHDQRDGRIHPPGTRVVDDRGAARRGLRGQLPGDVGAGREEGDVDAIEGLGPTLRRSRRSDRRPRSSDRPTGRRRAAAARRRGTPVR